MLVAFVALEDTMKNTVNKFLQRSYISTCQKTQNINHSQTCDIFDTEMDNLWHGTSIFRPR